MKGAGGGEREATMFVIREREKFRSNYINGGGGLGRRTNKFLIRKK